MTTCQHGYDESTQTTIDDDGITACCAAYSSIFMDDGTEYCKCCYGAVTGGHETERTSVPLDDPTVTVHTQTKE